jgi:hypothetical protein
MFSVAFPLSFGLLSDGYESANEQILDWFWVSLHSLCCGESNYVAVIGLVITVKLVCVIKS